MKNSVFFLLASVIGAIYFLIVLGIAPLNPTNDSWLLHSDTFGQYSGWLFFRASAWSFPIGGIHAWVPSLHLTVVQADSIPLLAILFKIISPLLGQSFQYFGLWIFTCYILQSLFGALLLRLLTNDEKLALIGAVFFVISPPLLWRMDHKSLCAHWLILATLYIYFSFAKDLRLTKAILLWGLCLVLSLLIHPYLFAMLYPLQFALVIFARLKIKFLHWSKNTWLVLILQQPILLLIAWAVGYFEIHSPASWGFSQFSTDLLGFINSYGSSAILPHLRHGGSQHEGYAYLGLGVIMLALWCTPEFLKSGLKNTFKRPAIDHRPLLLLCLLLWIYALSSHITIAGNTIINLDYFYAPFSRITGTFRSSGRFLWPLYYFILLSILLTAAMKKPKQARIILSAALLIQCIDLANWVIHKERLEYAKQPSLALTDPAWQAVTTKYKNLVLIPPRLAATDVECGDGTFTPELFNAFQYFAGSKGLTFNSSLAARADTKLIEVLCNESVRAIERGEVDKTSAYVLDPKQKITAVFAQKLSAQVNCTKTEGYWLCLPKL